MRKLSAISFLGLLLLWSVGTLQAGERPLFLPFDLTLGGQKAVMEDGNQLFAQIAEPVKPDAILALEEEVPLLIVNAFPCREDGTVEDTQAVGILFARDTDRVALNATMDKKPLPAGTYLANVVANGKTARIVFTVGEPKTRVEFKKVFEFLKKKAGME